MKPAAVTMTVVFAFAVPPGLVALSVSLTLRGFLPVSGGIVRLRFTVPDPQGSVSGKPGTALFEDRTHVSAPVTEALTVVGPPEPTVAGVAAQPEITGLELLA